MPDRELAGADRPSRGAKLCRPSRRHERVPTSANTSARPTGWVDAAGSSWYRLKLRTSFPQELIRTWEIAGSIDQANWHIPRRLRDHSTPRQLLSLPGTLDYFATRVPRRPHPEVPGCCCTSLLLSISCDIALFMGRLAVQPKRLG